MQALKTLLDELSDLLLFGTGRPTLLRLFLKLGCGKIQERLTTPLLLQVRNHDLLELKLAQFVYYRLFLIFAILWHLNRRH